MEDFNQDKNYNWQTGSFQQSEKDEINITPEKPKPIAPAIICFVISIVNILCCCCCGYIALIASIVLGIISLAKKWRGKGLAIAGIIISSISLIFSVMTDVILGDLSKAMTKVFLDTPKYYEEYSETGEIPEEFIEFNDEKYDWYWKITGNDDFDEFYSRYMKMYGEFSNSVNTETNSGEDVIGDDDFNKSDDSTNSDTTEATEKSDRNDEDSDKYSPETPVEL